MPVYRPLFALSDLAFGDLMTSLDANLSDTGNFHHIAFEKIAGTKSLKLQRHCFVLLGSYR